MNARLARLHNSLRKFQIFFPFDAILMSGTVFAIYITYSTDLPTRIPNPAPDFLIILAQISFSRFITNKIENHP